MNIRLILIIKLQQFSQILNSKKIMTRTNQGNSIKVYSSKKNNNNTKMINNKLKVMANNQINLVEKKERENIIKESKNRK